MSEPTLAERERMTTSYHAFLHNTSLTLLVLAPVLIALPPRKLDIYTLSLASAFALSANHLTAERTGAGILAHMTPSWALARPPPRQPQPSTPSTPTRSEEFSARYAAEKAQRRLLDDPSSPQPPTQTPPSALQELWLGGEREGWKERRLREEQEKLDQGEGYGGMIMDQIWEVWNWGERKAEEVKDKDRAVLDERKEEERAKRRDLEFPPIGKGR